MTRSGRRRIDPCADPIAGQGGESASLLSVLVNNIQIFGADTENAMPTFIAKTLVTRGWVAFERVSKNWFAFNAQGKRTREGLPTKIRLIIDGGARLSEPVSAIDDDFCVIPATPMFNVPAWDVVKRVETLGFIQGAVGQNVDALRQIAAILYNDESLSASIAAAEADRQNGKPTTKIYTPIGSEVKLMNFSPDAKSNIPDLMSVYTQTMEELDAATGRATVGEKQERRITDEIAVIENAASSTIDVVIDTFNRFAEWYGIDAIAARGSSLHRVEPETPPTNGADGTGGQPPEGGNE